MESVCPSEPPRGRVNRSHSAPSSHSVGESSEQGSASMPVTRRGRPFRKGGEGLRCERAYAGKENERNSLQECS